MSKIQIRKGLFETNSSSTHCIVIADDDSYNVNYTDTLEFTLGQFGWEHRIYNDTFTKAQYLYTAIKYLEDEESLKTLKKRLDFFHIPYSFEDVENNACFYIDHCDNLKYWVPMVCDDISFLLSYLFDENSFIETGNDGMDDDDFTKTRPEKVYLEFWKGN